MTDLLVAIWHDVCAVDDLLVDRGACVLVDGRQVALFRLGDGSLHAISNFDPFANAYVLSRGIVGCRDGRCKVSSPMYRHAFDLATGACLDDPTVRIPVYEARVIAGRVEVRSP
jgi:nitrite reductase (NADH) small subunit